MRAEWYRCPDCGYRHRITRGEVMRKLGHRKWLWCAICGRKRNFVRFA